MSSCTKHQSTSSSASPEPAVQAPAWELPGGQSLAEFAMRSGIVAPKLLNTTRRSSAPAPVNPGPVPGKTKEDLA